MKLETANIVLLGGFNPHIIEPHWLNKVGVCSDENDRYETEVLVGTGPQLTRFLAGGLWWEVSFEKLVVAVKAGITSAGSPVASCRRLLQTLPHTPIRAMGTNFNFKFDKDAWDGPTPSIDEIEGLVASDGEIQSRTTVIRSLREDGARVLFQLAVGVDSVSFDANFHRSVEGISMAQERLNDFDGDREFVKNVAKRFVHQGAKS